MLRYIGVWRALVRWRLIRSTISISVTDFSVQEEEEEEEDNDGEVDVELGRMKRRRGIEGSERSLISVSSVESFQV
jgi:hypothetical protein